MKISSHFFVSAFPRLLFPFDRGDRLRDRQPFLDLFYIFHFGERVHTSLFQMFSDIDPTRKISTKGQVWSALLQRVSEIAGDLRFVAYSSAIFSWFDSKFHDFSLQLMTQNGLILKFRKRLNKKTARNALFLLAGKKLTDNRLIKTESKKWLFDFRSYSFEFRIGPAMASIYLCQVGGKGGEIVDPGFMPEWFYTRKNDID